MITIAKKENRESTNNSDGAEGRRKEFSERCVKRSEGWVLRRKDRWCRYRKLPLQSPGGRNIQGQDGCGVAGCVWGSGNRKRYKSR